MREKPKKITESELEVMRVLWAADKPLNIAQIIEKLLSSRKWNGSTIKTLLRRLCEKGAVAQEKREVYYYRPLVTSEEYAKSSTQSIIDKLYSGSARDMIAALVMNGQLNGEDIKELRALLRETKSDEQLFE